MKKLGIKNHYKSSTIRPYTSENDQILPTQIINALVCDYLIGVSLK